MEKDFPSRASLELNTIIDEFCYEYRKAADRSRQELLGSLPPGAAAPVDKGIIQGKENQAAFIEQIAGPFRDRIREAISDIKAELAAEAAAAPSTEAVNSITLLRCRKSIQEEELFDLMKKYGNNAQAARAIAEIAEEQGYYIEFADIELLLRELASLERSIDKALLKTGSRLDDYLCLVKMEIDDIFDAFVITPQRPRSGYAERASRL